LEKEKLITRKSKKEEKKYITSPSLILISLITFEFSSLSTIITCSSFLFSFATVLSWAEKKKN